MYNSQFGIGKPKEKLINKITAILKNEIKLLIID
jgi:hypothetical protein